MKLKSQFAQKQRRSKALLSAASLGAILIVGGNYLGKADDSSIASEAAGKKKSQKPAVHFSKMKISVGKEKLEVEVAKTDKQKERGLMDRKAMSDSAGMLFIFEPPQVLNFWMKDTLIPLSIGYFDKDGKLAEILDMQPASPMDTQPTIYSSTGDRKYALEVNSGWFAKHGVKVGDRLKLR